MLPDKHTSNQFPYVKDIMKDTYAVLGEEVHIYQYKDLLILEDRREIHKNDELIEFSLKEYEVLLLLCKNPNRILTREELIHFVWGENYKGNDRTLDVHIRKIREKLNDSPDHPKYIKTVRGIGFRIVL